MQQRALEDGDTQTPELEAGDFASWLAERARGELEAERLAERLTGVRASGRKRPSHS